MSTFAELDIESDILECGHDGHDWLAILEILWWRNKGRSTCTTKDKAHLP